MKIKRSEYLDIVSLYRQGTTYKEIAEIYGVTRQRIGKIVKDHGLGASEGGFSVANKKKNELIAKVKSKEKDRHYMQLYGMTFTTYMEIAERHGRVPIKAFWAQRKNASHVGIPWNFSFNDWWSFWQASGLWSMRGRGADKYCMVRIGNTGAYEPGNVRIMTNSENVKNVRNKEQVTA